MGACGKLICSFPRSGGRGSVRPRLRQRPQAITAAPVPRPGDLSRIADTRSAARPRGPATDGLAQARADVAGPMAGHPRVTPAQVSAASAREFRSSAGAARDSESRSDRSDPRRPGPNCGPGGADSAALTESSDSRSAPPNHSTPCACPRVETPGPTGDPAAPCDGSHRRTGGPARSAGCAPPSTSASRNALALSTSAMARRRSFLTKRSWCVP